MIILSFKFTSKGLTRRKVLKSKMIIIKKLMSLCKLRNVAISVPQFFDVYKKIKYTAVLKSPFKFKKSWDHFCVIQFCSSFCINFKLQNLDLQQRKVVLSFLTKTIYSFSNSMVMTGVRVSKKLQSVK